MRVAQINFVPAPAGLDPPQLLARWPSLADIAEAVASAGAQVHVLQAAPAPASLRLRGVDYRFGAADPARIADWLDRIGADVAHVHGLGYAAQAHAIARLRPRLPIVLQDHADRVPRWRRSRWRQWFGAAAGIAFTSLELARPFADAGLFAPSTPLFAIAESSSRFAPGDRAAACGETGLYGDPCVLWLGHLDANKDPLCMLEGVARAAERLPGLRLWCAFATAPLLAQVRARIDADARLAGRVELLGPVAHARVQALMRAADLLVCASRRESCGYAALEALACGTPTVLSDIAAFRALSDGGRTGALWPCGDAAALAAALLRVAAQPPPRAQVRAHFEQRLSFAALGRDWARAYAQAAQAHAGRCG